MANTNLMDRLDDVCERQRNRKLAEAAWEQIARTGPCEYSADHHQGFLDGFADYLFWGKTDPPIVPPPRYRGFSYQSPLGYRTIEDWFTGYRHGVAAAIDSGYRRLVTGPVSTAIPNGPEAAFILPGEPVSAPAKTNGPTFQGQQTALPVDPAMPAVRFGVPCARDVDNPAPVGLPLPPAAVGADNEAPVEAPPDAPKPDGVQPACPGID